MITIYHNPRCRKSRETLELIQKKAKSQVKIIEYLNDVPTVSELKNIIKLLGVNAEDLVRKKETIYLENYKNKKMGEKEWIEAMVKHPILIERPIVLNGKKAALGRPPENVSKII